MIPSHLDLTDGMNNGRKVFVPRTANGEDMSAELSGFANTIGLEAAAPGRYSILLLLGLFGAFKSGTLNPARVVHEIAALEEGARSSSTKPQTQFKGAQLKGLWHKHYCPDGLSSMAQNLKNGIAKDGLPWVKGRVREAQETGEERLLCAYDINAIVHDAVLGTWQRRNDAHELTGEWIIYAQHEGQNYYLCLGQHDTGDDCLRQQIDLVCCKEFPFLAGTFGE